MPTTSPEAHTAALNAINALDTQLGRIRDAVRNDRPIAATGAVGGVCEQAAIVAGLVRAWGAAVGRAV